MIDDSLSPGKRVSIHPGTTMLEKHGLGKKKRYRTCRRKRTSDQVSRARLDMVLPVGQWTMGIAYGRVASPCSSVGSMMATPKLRLHVPLVAFYDTVGMGGLILLGVPGPQG